jgi:hypothetical protein
MFPRSLRRSILPLTLAAVAIQACPEALAVPLATSQLNFFGDHSCDLTVAGPGSKECTQTIMSTAGTEVVGTATFHQFGATSGGTALATVTASSSGEGGGTGDAHAEFTYYVGMGIIATPPFLPAGIPVTFTANGGVFGSAGPFSAVGGEASTVVGEFQGDVSGFINAGVDETSAIGGSISAPYSQSAQFMFDFEEGPPIAQVQLDALCGGAVGHPGGSLSCTALADPFVGFDQAAFDTLAGPSSFPLANYFALVLSDGVTIGPSAAPEPPVLSLLVFGLILVGRRLRL